MKGFFTMRLKCRACLGALLILLFLKQSVAAGADELVFDCSFPGTFAFVVTINDQSPWATIGTEAGTGDKAKAYYDNATGAWILVEFVNDGKLPSTLTTILRDGKTWHSRHTLDILGKIVPSQLSGMCKRKIAN
jgi:hypothetical protein